ncbi:hypothetical protein [Sabulicella glaciei]|uniref:Uncharacterized protein n=1 Tax=Sabulicella glaciei TaxID=2984948 RepID=A0ABT3P1D6_9PROT|nr:hypothetical protein [Roseococcus sp. MDT2-1-1]MCW8088212.1 hypothetical protein [Roseococcus sp. MDT2-1-1]
MKVYVDEDGHKRLIGRAEIPEETGPVHREWLFGGESAIYEDFAIGSVTRFGTDGRTTVERAVILSPLQRADFLPGWAPLAS